MRDDTLPLELVRLGVVVQPRAAIPDRKIEVYDRLVLVELPMSSFIALGSAFPDSVDELVEGMDR